MIKLRLSGTTRNEAVAAATRMREQFGQLVDFGMPRAGRTGETLIYGYMFTAEQLATIRDEGEPTPNPDMIEGD